MRNAWQSVKDFERCVAEYAEAPHAVAVDSCTNALFLCLRLYISRWVIIPKRTYVGVAQSVVNAGHKLKFNELDWHGVYMLGNTDIIDSARRFRAGMYLPKTLYCLSFHIAKHVPIGRGGMILLDDESLADRLRRMRFDGRREGVAAVDDTFVEGWHMVMQPEQASRGLELMRYVGRYNEDLPKDDYADLSKSKYFREANNALVW